MKCTGRVPLKGDDGRQLRDDHGVRTRPCKRDAIAGATVCRSHGGGAPQVAAKAAVRAEVLRWGLGTADVDPGEILLRLVSQSAARAQRYADELEALTAEHEQLRDALVREAHGEFGPVGEYARGLVVLEAEERDRCAGFAAKAVAAGLAERQVKLAERHGALIADVLRAVLADPALALSAEQRRAIPDVGRRVLALVR